MRGRRASNINATRARTLLMPLTFDTRGGGIVGELRIGWTWLIVLGVDFQWSFVNGSFIARDRVRDE